MVILLLLDKDGFNRKNGGLMCKMIMKLVGSWRYLCVIKSIFYVLISSFIIKSFNDLR